MSSSTLTPDSLAAAIIAARRADRSSKPIKFSDYEEIAELGLPDLFTNEKGPAIWRKERQFIIDILQDHGLMEVMLKEGFDHDPELILGVSADFKPPKKSALRAVKTDDFPGFIQIPDCPLA